MRRSILLYVYALAGGGAERVVATLASGLARRGHDVTLATDFAVPDLEHLIDPQVRRVDLGRGHARSVQALARYLATARPDVSLSATGVSNLKHAAAATIAGRRRRAMLSFHGHVESEPGLLSQAGNRLTPVVTRLTGRSIFVSDDLKAAFARRGADPRRSVRIYNPIVAAAEPSTPFCVAERSIVLGVGRLVAAKGFATLIRAFARLADRRHRLVIIGEGPARSELEQEAARLGIADRVQLPGWQANAAPFYAEAACCVCASRRESFGNVIVEALAYGVPVVATDCGGPREILDQGRFGELVPVGDETAMADAIERALRQPGDASLRRTRAAAFSVDAALDAYEQVIEATIAAAP